ncbi:MAG: cytochrome ubiquinol oxidase subunit I [Desulfarculaceae bacterium]|jgi:mono/diheme cytochrome c family protein
MNYPVWEAAATGGGLIIAIIAIVHVYIAHFAVGGGIFLVLTEWKAYRENDRRLVDYVSGHTRFFLLVTLVLGALTGVGIWLAISVVHPGATSFMIHTFVFAWATEWVFFVVEIVSLLVYYYTFNKMDRANHLRVGWIYAAAAWLSLFMIGAIISFMLTPGSWPQTKSFWSAFFNPSFWPSLFFRTGLALVFAGIYGLITSTRIADTEFQDKVVRYCARWVVLPFIVLVPSAWWYLESIPPQAQAMILGGSQDIVPFLRTLIWMSPVILLAGVALYLRMPKATRQAMAFVLLVIGIVYMGSFEYVRETGRRPYVIYGHMYSNGILKSQLAQTQKQGVLATAKWTAIDKVTPENRLSAGRQLFALLCMSCHSIGGPRNDIVVQTAKLDAKALNALIVKMGGADKAFMPPFPGTAQEKEALTVYLTKGLPR